MGAREAVARIRSGDITAEAYITQLLKQVLRAQGSQRSQRDRRRERVGGRSRRRSVASARGEARAGRRVALLADGLA
jgi:hypothetical protein